MNPAAIDLFRLFTEVGAVPGEDFSWDLARQSYHLNERCFTLLQAAYPDMAWDEVFADAEPDNSAAVEDLHKTLGLPFIDRLAARMALRLPELPDPQAAGYIQVIFGGVTAATGVDLYPFVVEQLGMAGHVRLEWLLRQEELVVPDDTWLFDLMEAAGAPQTEFSFQAGEVWLDEAGLTRLSQIWQGDYVVGQE
ncbi:MAG: hypothetical protein HC812_16800 [Leptolyngbya sp. RL_3_1]|nr:hypothetical protein [Leptolyngbya sp. RL_3_1]